MTYKNHRPRSSHKSDAGGNDNVPLREFLSRVMRALVASGAVASLGGEGDNEAFRVRRKPTMREVRDALRVAGLDEPVESHHLLNLFVLLEYNEQDEDTIQ